MGRAIAMLGLVVGIAGLVLQFTLSIPSSMAAGRSLLSSLIWFFSFFTILTNVGAVLVYMAVLTGRPGWFRRDSVQAGVLVAIVVVCIVYATVLAALWQPRGLFVLADVVLHYVAPAIFTIWWVGFARAGTTGLRDMAGWLAYPLAYLGWVMLRGAFAGEYPYPFLDLTVNSLAQVLLSSAAILGLFIVVSAIAVAADRLPPPSRKPSTQT